MSEPVILIELVASLKKAKSLMYKHGVKRLPVVENGVFMGIFTASD
jgi:CBS domain-containing protein